MKVNTRIFGEIEIGEDKIIDFTWGLLGFPNMNKFTLIHDKDKKDVALWYMQSLDVPDFAIPMVDPLTVKQDYNPAVKEDSIEPVEPLTNKNMLMLVSVTVPEKLEDMTVNLNAPFLINTDTHKGVQVEVAENAEEYVVKYPVYDFLNKK
jgi:flagellar assembly factor FliW